MRITFKSKDTRRGNLPALTLGTRSLDGLTTQYRDGLRQCLPPDAQMIDVDGIGVTASDSDLVARIREGREVFLPGLVMQGKFARYAAAISVRASGPNLFLQSWFNVRESPRGICGALLLMFSLLAGLGLLMTAISDFTSGRSTSGPVWIAFFMALSLFVWSLIIIPNVARSSDEYSTVKSRLSQATVQALDALGASWVHVEPEKDQLAGSEGVSL